MTEKIIIIVVGAAAGLFPVLLTAFLSWIEKRSLASKQNRALERAKKQVEFINSWVDVQKPLCSESRFEQIKSEAAADLDLLRKNLSSTLLEEDKTDAEEKDTNLIQRLLLAYRPYNAAGWVLHTLFYMFLGITLLMTLGMGYDSATNEFSVSNFLSDLPFMFVLLVIPLIIIRWFAVRTDRKAEEKIGAKTIRETN